MLLLRTALWHDRQLFRQGAYPGCRWDGRRRLVQHIASGYGKYAHMRINNRFSYSNSFSIAIVNRELIHCHSDWPDIIIRLVPSRHVFCFRHSCLSVFKTMGLLPPSNHGVNNGIDRTYLCIKNSIFIEVTTPL